MLAEGVKPVEREDNDSGGKRIMNGNMVLQKAGAGETNGQSRRTSIGMKGRLFSEIEGQEVKAGA